VLTRAVELNRGEAVNATTSTSSQPARLDLEPLPQPEIAVAVQAELVAWRHARTASPAELLEAVDPVFGMTVAVGPDTPQAEYEQATSSQSSHCPDPSPSTGAASSRLSPARASR